MRISELKPGQIVTIGGFRYEYKGIQKIKTNLGKVQKIVFQGMGEFNRRLYPLTDGSATLESKNIDLL